MSFYSFPILEKVQWECREDHKHIIEKNRKTSWTTGYQNPVVRKYEVQTTSLVLYCPVGHSCLHLMFFLPLCLMKQLEEVFRLLGPLFSGWHQKRLMLQAVNKLATKPCAANLYTSNSNLMLCLPVMICMLASCESIVSLCRNYYLLTLSAHCIMSSIIYFDVQFHFVVQYLVALHNMASILLILFEPTPSLPQGVLWECLLLAKEYKTKLC